MQITRAVRPKGAPQKYHVYVDPGDGLVHAQNNRTGVTDHTGATTDVVLASLLTDLGSTTATITLSDDVHSLTANVTPPANIGVQAVHGTLLKPASGVTLTLNGTLGAGPYQIFDLSAGGSVALGPLASIGARSEWFGAKFDGTTDDTDAHKKLAAAIAAGGTWTLPGRTSLTDQITVTKPVKVVGASAAATILRAKSGATGPLLNIDLPTSQTGMHIESLNVDLLTNSVAVVGISATNCHRVRGRDINVSGGTTGFLATACDGIINDLNTDSQTGVGIDWQSNLGLPELVDCRVGVATGGTMQYGVRIQVTDPAATPGGFYLRGVKVNGFGGTFTGAGIAILGPAGTNFEFDSFLSNSVSDGVTGAPAILFQNARGIDNNDCWYTPQDYSTRPVTIDNCLDINFYGGTPSGVTFLNGGGRYGFYGCKFVCSTYFFSIPTTGTPGEIYLTGGNYTGGAALADNPDYLSRALQTYVYQSGTTFMTNRLHPQDSLALVDLGSGKRANMQMDSADVLHLTQTDGVTDRLTVNAVGRLTLAEKIVATGGFRQTIDGWYMNAVAASLVNTPPTRLSGPANTPYIWIAPRAGSVTALSGKIKGGSITAGTLTLNFQINGATQYTAVLNSATPFATAVAAVGANPFVSGDELTVIVSTSSTFAPTTLNLRASLEVEM